MKSSRIRRPSLLVLPMTMACLWPSQCVVVVDAYATAASAAMGRATAFPAFVPKQVVVPKKKEARTTKKEAVTEKETKPWKLVVPVLSDTEKREQQALVEQQQQQQRSQYSLGIGKNAPVISKSTAMPQRSYQSNEEMAQYWMGHQAVRDLPTPDETNIQWEENQGQYHGSTTSGIQPRHIPPMTTASVSASASAAAHQQEPVPQTTQKQPKAKMQRPKLDYSQRAKDALFILPQQREEKPLTATKDNSSTSSTLTVGWKTTDQLDPNTIWVEMLLAHHHNEQMMLQAAH